MDCNHPTGCVTRTLHEVGNKNKIKELRPLEVMGREEKKTHALPRYRGRFLKYVGSIPSRGVNDSSGESLVIWKPLGELRILFI